MVTAAPQLADDHFLNCVPGSHLRPNTDAEAAVLRSQAAADLDSVSMPGATVVRMAPGDVRTRPRPRFVRQASLTEPVGLLLRC